MNILDNLDMVNTEIGKVFGPLKPGEYRVTIADWQLQPGKNGKASYFQLKLLFHGTDDGRVYTETIFNGGKKIILSQMASQLELEGETPATIIKAALESELTIWVERNEYTNIHFMPPFTTADADTPVDELDIDIENL